MFIMTHQWKKKFTKKFTKALMDILQFSILLFSVRDNLNVTFWVKNKECFNALTKRPRTYVLHIRVKGINSQYNMHHLKLEIIFAKTSIRDIVWNDRLTILHGKTHVIH